MNTLQRRQLMEDVARRATRRFQFGPPRAWMEALECRRLLSATVTNLPNAIRIDQGNANDSATVMALQADGKILIGGYDSSAPRESGSGVPVLIRLNADRTLDTTFGDGGIAHIDYNRDMSFSDIQVLADGSIVGTGATYDHSINRFDYGVVKLTADGHIDTSFGENGLATVDVTGDHENDWSYFLLADEQGRILVSGSTNEQTDQGMAFTPSLIRLTADGDLDTSFGDGGMLRPTFGDLPATEFGGGEPIAILPDGGILLRGQNGPWWANGAINPSDKPPGGFLLKLHADGSVDESFGDSGYAFFGDADGQEGFGSDVAVDVAVQGDGKLVVALAKAGFTAYDLENQVIRYAGGGIKLMRLNADGSVDSSFTEYDVPGSDGSAPITGDLATIVAYAMGGPTSDSLQIADDCSILISFYQPIAADNTRSKVTVVRFSPDGEPISSHDLANPTVGASASWTQASLLTPDGRLIAAGGTTDAPAPEGPRDGTSEANDEYILRHEAWMKTFDIFVAELQELTTPAVGSETPFNAAPKPDGDPAPAPEDPAPQAPEELPPPAAETPDVFPDEPTAPADDLPDPGDAANPGDVLDPPTGGDDSLPGDDNTVVEELLG